MADPSLHPIEASHLHARRERVFLVLAGLFLGSMTMLNILGISRFIHIFSFDYTLADGKTLPITFALAVGVLPYPVTFLCTDFVSEFYGRRRANWMVMVGLMLNVWVVFILWLGGVLPGFENVVDGQPCRRQRKHTTVLRDPGDGLRSSRCVDGGLPCGTVMRRLPVSLLETRDRR